jgi:hypothetical protein
MYRLPTTLWTITPTALGVMLYTIPVRLHECASESSDIHMVVQMERTRGSICEACLSVGLRLP